MKITTAADLGQAIKTQRKRDRLTLEQAAAICGVSYAFFYALEHGKETVRLDKVLQVLHSLGIKLVATPRSWDAKD